MTTYHPDTTLLSDPQGDGADGKTLLDTARDAANDAGANARDIAFTAGQQVADTAGRATRNSTQFVQQNPSLAIVGAVGIGLLIGLSLQTRQR
ncbi:MAG: hypothetical protein ACEPO2_11840 [Pelagibaca sp.]